ncbi:MAG TPA: PQQ-dependent sugar dehydrogenase [Methylophilaceae bacterium]|nr:PQQ-dependent sugar dehydrogenase [Methylophilaceae bacterium]
MIFHSCLLILALGFSLASCANEAKVSPVPNENAGAIHLPKSFHIEVFADFKKHPVSTRGAPRMMTFDADGHLYVSLPRQGKVVMLARGQSRASFENQAVLVAENLNAPHGLAFVGEKLYVANQDGIVVLEKDLQATARYGWPAKTVTSLVKNLPTGGHTLKSLKLGPDGLLYINVGSSCNVCIESDPLRATILRYTPDGKAAGAIATLGRHTPNPIYASGLRNSQGFAWHPTSQMMFATNNGADNRSEFKSGQVNDELPPEHLNIIAAGQHYGWPYCWGRAKDAKGMFPDPNFVGEPDFCQSATPPVITFTAHSTPMGISFLDKTNWPAAYKKDAIVALHGSWNRKNPSGYKLIQVRFEGDKPIEVLDFATGWLDGHSSFGRPVDVIVGPDGALYVSDDRAEVIYRISYKP